MKKILKLKLSIFLEYQNVKTFLERVTLQTGPKKLKNWKYCATWLKKLKILCHGIMLLMILTTKELLELFTKNNCIKNKSKIVSNWKSNKEKRS